MLSAISHFFETWSVIYSDSSFLRTLISFAHIAGLVVSGGYALSEDRAILSSARDAGRTVARSAHIVVIGGLGVVFASGLLLVAANLDSYLVSRVFWIKMFFVALLLANGGAVVRAERGVALGDSRAWMRLRRAAWLSVVLWTTTILAGAALPNV
jgi:hypothetical protein